MHEWDAFGVEQSQVLGGAGDRDNVVYGQLYALDQASYSRHDPLRTAAGARARSGYAYGALGETDGDSQVRVAELPSVDHHTLVHRHNLVVKMLVYRNLLAAASAQETCVSCCGRSQMVMSNS